MFDFVEDLEKINVWELVKKIKTADKKEADRLRRENAHLFQELFDDKLTYAIKDNGEYVITRNITPDKKVIYQIYTKESFERSEKVYRSMKEKDEKQIRSN
jgi:hypothetical protein